MPSLSKRYFLQGCYRAVVAALLYPRMGLVTGCTERNGTRVPSDGTDRASAEPSRDRTAARVDQDFEPGYLALHRTGELEQRGETLWSLMDECRLCPRRCGTDRLAGERGFCGASSTLEVASHHPHFGEERPLVGSGGSGTIFFTHCSLRCVFCINWQISQGGEGRRTSIEDLADRMLDLQARGCHNINVVTPTHYAAHIVKALDIAAARGLRLPLVYNTCGWEDIEILRVLDGIVDIYLPDFKYADGAMAAKYSSGAESYPEVTRAALREMHRQVGVAEPASDGLIYRGLMVRHLVMPNDVSGSCAVVSRIAEDLPARTYVNLMSQYRPMYRAYDDPRIARRITREEYGEALRCARDAGLTRLDIQGSPS